MAKSRNVEELNRLRHYYVGRLSEAVMAKEQARARIVAWDALRLRCALAIETLWYRGGFTDSNIRIAP